VIEGGKTTIYNIEGKLCWYGGRFKYKNQAIYGSVTEIEKNTEIVEVNAEGYLERIEDTEWLQNQNTGEKYSDLQQAIEVAKEYETIKVLRNKQQSISTIIPQNKDVILDLSGNTISTYGTIEVVGNLEIEDTENNGKIESYTVDAVIKNKGEGIVEVKRRNS